MPPLHRTAPRQGASLKSSYDYGEDEELHVLITGDNQADVSGGVRVLT